MKTTTLTILMALLAPAVASAQPLSKPARNKLKAAILNSPLVTKPVESLKFRTRELGDGAVTFTGKTMLGNGLVQRVSGTASVLGDLRMLKAGFVF